MSTSGSGGYDPNAYAGAGSGNAGTFGGGTSGGGSSGSKTLDQLVVSNYDPHRLQSTGAEPDVRNPRRFGDASYGPYTSKDTIGTILEYVKNSQLFEDKAFENLQAGLYMAGFYGKIDPAKITVGDRADSRTMSALTKFLKQAAVHNTTKEGADQPWLDYLSQLAKKDVYGVMGGGSGGRGGGGGGGSGSARAPFSPTVSNPEDLKAIARQVSVNVLGEEISDPELDKFVKLYQGMETGAQRHGYDAAYAGGTTVQAANPQVAAEQQLRKDHAVEAGSHDIANAFSNFLQIIGGNPNG